MNCAKILTMGGDLEVIYWIFLAETLGYGSSKIKKVADNFKSSKIFYESGLEAWRQKDLFTEKELIKLKNKYFLSKAEKIFSYCLKKSYNVVHYNSSQYPNRLKSINNPPAVLYVCGNLPEIDEKLSIGIVGTRKPTEYGKRVAFNFGYNLAKCDLTVVSGGALGIDSFAQSGAIEAGGKVISVLGCGFDCKYLVSNEKLRALTKENGALISEYPPNTPAIPRNFPIRNRIISGISLGVIVVEAGQKSGALITANTAKKQGRDVFAVPGSINAEQSIGPNNLIKNGAKLVTSVEDILEEYNYDYTKKLFTNGLFVETKDIETNNSFKKLSLEKVYQNKLKGYKEPEDTEHKMLNQPLKIKGLSNVSEDVLKVYESLGDIPLNVESIILKTKMSLSQILRHLTELEILDLVKSLPGGKYKKV